MKRRKQNPEKYMDSRLKRFYNISLEIYETILVSQGDRCKICFIKQSETEKIFQIDHDHECCPGLITCGKCIRGILCFTCNNMLGSAQDNPTLLINAARYLSEYKEDNGGPSTSH
jgi:hypothetical protein